MTGDNSTTEGNGIDGSLPNKITIIDRIDNSFVREIGQCSFRSCETITHVTIKKGINKIHVKKRSRRNFKRWNNSSTKS